MPSSIETKLIGIAYAQVDALGNHSLWLGCQYDCSSSRLHTTVQAGFAACATDADVETEKMHLTIVSS